MRRWLRSLLAAGVGTTLLPLAISVYAWFTWTPPAHSPMDDAPKRAAGLFVALSPILFAFAVGYFGALVAFLRTIDRLSLVWIVLVNGLTSVAFGIWTAALLRVEWPGAAMSASVVMVSLTIGGLAVWGTGALRDL